ncbi:c2H2-type domain-containing protein [Trichonephila clavata]|uniref:C2H2-type domain-containing protein n=1 Tax=Trichonephila clavata TaxID=2740835 RepID=A0A8X6FWI2_TRICU|nr:c2H2-type domain-containing protein [Trichonephila clavata]
MLSRENISRIHLTTRQNIKNIKRSFGLTNQRHADDATSVRLMLEEMTELGTDNSILGCKFQGCLSSEYEGLNNEDFLLAIQHPLKKEMLKKFGKEIVCVDSTHGTNSYNVKLITVLGVSDLGEGFPVAWCISNREDFTALRKKFLLIKNNTETSITFNFFMSDDAPAFYNSWSDVLDFPDSGAACLSQKAGHAERNHQTPSVTLACESSETKLLVIKRDKQMWRPQEEARPINKQKLANTAAYSKMKIEGFLKKDGNILSEFSKLLYPAVASI